MSVNCSVDYQDVEARLGFRVNHAAATNATTKTSKVSGLTSASRMPAATALNAVAWLVSTAGIPLRMTEMNNKNTNPMNEKNIPRPITFTARMFYSWALQQRANAQSPYCVKTTMRAHDARHISRKTGIR
jgi:hypothetical protein